MKLIFVTRKVDWQDPRSGFVYTWIEKLAGAVDELIVICLEQGDKGKLPGNVKVLSMGKEKGYWKPRIWWKYRKILKEQLPDSDGVFIHMHPIYAIAASGLVKKNGKKMVLWYTHKSVDRKLRMAENIVDKIFTASKESFRLPSEKVEVVGHGIDTDHFKSRNLQHSGDRFVLVDRISPTKNVETVLNAMHILNQRKSQARLDIYGSSVEGQEKYQMGLKRMIEIHKLNLRLGDKPPMVGFYDSVDNRSLPSEVYSTTDIVLSASETGSLDKAILEAAACECLVLTSNEAFTEPLSKISPMLLFKKRDSQDLADKIQALLALPEDEKNRIRKELRAWVVREHNLDNLVKKIVGEFKK